ncbi:hypothetical protein BT93_B1145 [Corymbia citriodora subsp. variegata]|nr:hypothetical protein BT93_B1145 [Corymbia citriodora subsp. variegata]
MALIISADDAAADGIVKPSWAYVTYLAKNGDQVMGVIGLAKGLRKAESKYPLVVAVLPNVAEDHRRILEDQGCIVREIEPIYPPEEQFQFPISCYVINYSKLRIWEFVDYSKMIYLDGNVQVFDNIDRLFHLPNGFFCAVKDCLCEKTWSHSPQYSIGYCQQCPDNVHWPDEDIIPRPPLYFNAGMFMYEPNLDTYHNLLETLKIAPPTPLAEQDFLNKYFNHVYEPIPYVYNLVLAMLWRHPEKVELDEVKVVHYGATGSKPWRYTGKEENMDRDDIKMLVKKWWDIYNDESLNYKDMVAAEEAARQEIFERFLVALSEADGPYMTGSPAA